MRIVSDLTASSVAKHLMMVIAAALCLTACQPADVRPAAEPADLVLLGGKIATVDDANPQAEALAARGGKIVAVGSRAEVEPFVGDGTEVIELEGRLAIPGFIEGHGHFLSLGNARMQLDLTKAGNWQDVVDQVAAAVAEVAPGDWIRGRGWHQDKWDAAPEPAIEGLPIHDSLSAVSPENPVFLTHASGHALFANAQAMDLAGIDAGTADPPGGEILRDSKGEATGFFRETAQRLIRRARSSGGSTPPEEMREMARLASEECLAKGITSFQDAGSSFEEIELLRGLDAEDALGVRLWMMVREGNEALAEKLAAAKTKAADNGHFAVGGIKVSMDGALGARGAWLLEPYSDSPESTGLNLVPVEDVQKTAELAIEHGVQLCIHAIGDRANREVLDVFEQAFAAHPDKSDLRWRVEHAQHLHPDDIPRFAELGVIASMQGAHCTSDGPWVPDRLGEKRSEEGAYVWQKLMRSGAVIMNGTDVPVEDVDPIANFHSSVTRMMNTGEAFYPEQRMSREEALRSYTLNAAFGAFEEAMKGSLEVGKLADVVVLSKDILTVPEEEIPSAEIVYTIVGGEVVHSASQ